MTRSFPIIGQCLIPSSARAVALNLTIVGPTGAGHLVVWPYNTPAPATSMLNFVGGETAIANGAIVGLTADGSLNLSVVAYVAGAGSTHLLVDVAGYFPAGGTYQYVPITPCRIVDTRNPPGPTGGPPLSYDSIRSFPIAGYCGVPSAARAASLNLTIVGPTTAGHLIVWPYNTPIPQVSNLNYVAGEPALPNGAIVSLTPDPVFNVSALHGSGGGTAHLLVDVSGYFE